MKKTTQAKPRKRLVRQLPASGQRPKPVTSQDGASLGVAVIPPIYGDVSRQNALFAPTCGKITAIPREPRWKDCGQ